MKRFILLIAVVLLLFVASACYHLYRGITSATRHLTETRPKKVTLIQGTNFFSFPVVQGRYHIRIGREELEPVDFPFSIKGLVDDETGRVSLEEDYQPSGEGARQGPSEGGISRSLKIGKGQTQVDLWIVVSCPSDKRLKLSFFGVK